MARKNRQDRARSLHRCFGSVGAVAAQMGITVAEASRLCGHAPEPYADEAAVRWTDAQKYALRPRIICHKGLSEAARRVLGAFLDAARRGTVAPTMATIAQDIGINRNAVSGIILRLKKRGYIATTGHRGGPTTPVYILQRDLDGEPIEPPLRTRADARREAAE